VEGAQGRLPRGGGGALPHPARARVGTVRAIAADFIHADIAQLRVLAAQGNADAEYVLGERYWTGEGVPQDDKAAAEWFLKAARQGHAHAQFSIGFFYREGRGVAQDHKVFRRFEWYLKAARRGHAAAQTTTGVSSYGQGEGVEQDHDQAMAWYLKAAQQGQLQAQFNSVLQRRLPSLLLLPLALARGGGGAPSRAARCRARTRGGGLAGLALVLVLQVDAQGLAAAPLLAVPALPAVLAHARPPHWVQ
jgi:hypothetical protein